MKKAHAAPRTGLRLLPIYGLIHHIRQDKVSVYAAQASFFTIISAVPMVSMIAGIAGLLWPSAAEQDKIIAFFAGTVPDAILELAVYLFDEAASASGIPVLSISALFVWWSAAKGVGAIREGVQIVYEAPGQRGYIRKMGSSILYTVIFVILAAVSAGSLLFGEYLLELAGAHLPTRLLHMKTPLFLISLTLLFGILYTAVSRRSRIVSRRFRHHIPGAFCASAGWLSFSWGYSHYMHHASRPYLLYGDLTAACLIMLWLYFCMIILLCGAEINKMFFAKNAASSQLSPTAER